MNEPNCENCQPSYDEGYVNGQAYALSLINTLRKEGELLRQRLTTVGVQRTELFDALRTIAAKNAKDFESPHVVRNTLALARATLVQTSIPPGRGELFYGHSGCPFKYCDSPWACEPEGACHHANKELRTNG